jgi:hypothetical protein
VTNAHGTKDERLFDRRGNRTLDHIECGRRH